MSEHAQLEADQSMVSVFVPVVSSSKEAVSLPVLQVTPTSKELVKDVFLLVLNVLLAQPQAVLTALKDSSSTPTPEFVLPVPPVTSVKNKSMEPAKESAILDISTKTVPVSSESAHPDSRTTVSEDALFHRPTPTDVKSLLSDLMVSAFRTVELLSTPTATPEPVILVLLTAEPV